MIEPNGDFNIKMIEGDYGIVLPIKIESQTLDVNDKFSVKIFKKVNEEPIIAKEYTNIENNTIEFKLEKEESEKLKVGRYFYDLDWFQDNNFLGNVIAKKSFIVKEKAGA